MRVRFTVKQLTLTYLVELPIEKDNFSLGEESSLKSPNIAMVSKFYSEYWQYVSIILFEDDGEDSHKRKLLTSYDCN